jgi:hypothetical protein
VCFLNTENISAFVGFSWKIEIEMHGAAMKIKLFTSVSNYLPSPEKAFKIC